MAHYGEIRHNQQQEPSLTAVLQRFGDHMTKTLAIVTGDAPDSLWMSIASQPLSSFQTRIVADEPDVSFRALSSADIIVLGPDVSRSRAMKLLRAFTRTGVASPALAVVSPDEPVEQALGYLSSGASAVILDTDDPGELSQAVAQVSGGRLYLSSGLIPAVLNRYRELCAELRRKLDRGLEPFGLCCRSR